jgi:hypothetical protein
MNEIDPFSTFVILLNFNPSCKGALIGSGLAECGANLTCMADPDGPLRPGD